ncbi:MAG: methyltransferase domain-containing protein [Hyphomonas sp.]|uniref:class I SAM-dependent methyltransferase n=1 Tax=Hyphomonas sp. TaxID=87 RepID=UPI003526C6BF
MTPPSRPVMAAFDAERAPAYDDSFAALHAIREVLHLVARAEFATLPPDARILIAGAGTGAEVRTLATHYPGFCFALVDPSGPMLDVARAHAEREGFAERCSFHTGYVEDLPDTGFDAATSLLVSHFLTEAAERTAYFRSIAERLRPGAPLFVADLCTNRDAADFGRLMEVWLNLLALTGMTEEGRENYRGAFGQDFAVHGPADVIAMMETAGFARPVQCLQAGLIRGWMTAKA